MRKLAIGKRKTEPPSILRSQERKEPKHNIDYQHCDDKKKSHSGHALAQLSKTIGSHGNTSQGINVSKR
jgi:hypothetical protein